VSHSNPEKKETTDTISLLKGSGYTHGTGKKRRFPSLGAVTAASPIVQLKKKVPPFRNAAPYINELKAMNETFKWPS
jgi:hypothetical protein